jgi:flagellar basal-body rod protein FlgF
VGPEIYVALSGQVALQKRMDTLANNVANATTPGFRAEHISFASILDEQTARGTAYAVAAKPTFKNDAGPAVPTGNPLDLAIQGDAFFMIETPAGVAYTRDGRMQLSPEGELRSVNGYPFMGADGGPIRVNPRGGTITIEASGAISQDNVRIGAIGLSLLPANANLTRHDNSAFLSDAEGEPVVDTTVNRVKQGFIEQSNVNPVMEMTRLIALSRTFDAIASSLEARERTIAEAVRTLAGNN